MRTVGWWTLNIVGTLAFIGMVLGTSKICMMLLKESTKPMDKPLPMMQSATQEKPSNEPFVIDQQGNIVKKNDQIAIALTGLLGGFVMDINDKGIVIAIPMFCDITKPVGGLIKSHQRRFDQSPNQS